MNEQQSHQTKQAASQKVWAKLGMVLLCFAASFLGAWAFLGTGLVRLDASRTISDNSQTIVMQQGEVIADVFKKVSPSTVSIITTSVVPRSSFYNDVSEGAGSGIVVSPDGYVLTNKHVVPDGVDKVSVIMHDGREFTDVKVVGRDPSNDIAFLKIEGVSDLKAAEIGDSNQVEPGQQVVAIGNALGTFRNSVASGIISGIGRPLTATDEGGDASQQLEDMLQTDAAINPGNSGGPLVNLKGEVIGINTAIALDGQGIGFAIPINVAKVQIDSVVQKGKLIKAYLGVRYVPVTKELAEDQNLPVTVGALVDTAGGQEAIVPDSPAAKAGLRARDIITKVNDIAIVEGKGLATVLSQFPPGQNIQLTIMREGREQVVTLALGEFPL